MADNDREVKVSLVANVARFQSAFGKAAKSVTSFVGKVTSKLGTMPSLSGAVAGAILLPFTLLKKLLGGILSTIGDVFSALKAGLSGMLSLAKKVGFVVAGLTAAWGLMMQKVANTGDELAKLSKRTLTSVGWLSKMKYVLGLADLTMMDFGVTIKSLNLAVEGSVRGSKEYLEMWDKIGVDFRNVRGEIKDTESLFMDVLEGIRRLPEGEQIGLAAKIFGRSGPKMLTLPRREVIEAQGAEAVRMGVVWTPEQAAAAEEYNDSILTLKTSFGGLVKTFSTPFLKPMAESFDRLADRVSEFQPETARLSERVKELRTTAINAINAVVKRIKDVDFAAIIDAWSGGQWRARLSAMAGSAVVIGEGAIDLLASYAGEAFDVVWGRIGKQVLGFLQAAAAALAKFAAKGMADVLKEEPTRMGTLGKIAGLIDPTGKDRPGIQEIMSLASGNLTPGGAAKFKMFEGIMGGVSALDAVTNALSDRGQMPGVDRAAEQDAARAKMMGGAGAIGRLAVPVQISSENIAELARVALAPITINITGGIITDDILMRKFQTFWTRLRKGG